MSERTQWITGQLTPERMKRARLAADNQLGEYPSEDRGDSAPYAGMPRATRIFQENAAREFLAQVLGVDEIPSEYKGRWSSRTAAHARLIIAPKEIKAKHARRWVLIAGRAPDFTVLGWCWASEAPERGEWRPDAPRPAWFIPWAKLRNPPSSPSVAPKCE